MRAMILQVASARVADLRAVAREPLFGLYILGHFATTIGFWMQRIAVGWLAWRLTGSEAWLGLIAFAELFPSILSSLAGGHLADRFSRVRVMLVGQGLVTCVSAGLAVGHLTGWLRIEALAGLMVVLGVIAGGMLPSRLAMPHLLVRPEMLASALALNSTTFNLSRLIGPALAAPILLTGDAAGVFAASLGANLAFFLLLLRIDGRTRRAARRAGGGSFRSVLADLFRARDLTAVILLQFAQGALLRPASELFPAFADEVFRSGPGGLSALNAAVGVGAIIGALGFVKARADMAALRMVTLTGGLLCAALGLFGLTSTLWMGAALMVAYGACMSISNVMALAYVQGHVAPGRLGRVLSVYGIVFRVAPALGALGFGLTAELAGLPATTILFSFLGGGATLAFWFAIRGVAPTRAGPADQGSKR
ncbi:MAG: MFS transporter [Paracoccaceae bacterium]|nr:MAG: MFS transporter [Paracoccaceae bacterium]